MIEDAAQAVKQALAMNRAGHVTSLGGKRVPVAAETLCLHGDQPGPWRLPRRSGRPFRKKESRLPPR